MTDYGPLTPHIQFLIERGYSIIAHTPGYEHTTLVNMDTGMGAEVTKNGTELIYITAFMFKVSSVEFQNSHPRFEMFERNMGAIINALSAAGLGNAP